MLCIGGATMGNAVAAFKGKSKGQQIWPVIYNPIKINAGAN
jgi:hypothetical protein